MWYSSISDYRLVPESELPRNVLGAVIIGTRTICHSGDCPQARVSTRLPVFGVKKILRKQLDVPRRWNLLTRQGKMTRQGHECGHQQNNGCTKRSLGKTDKLAKGALRASIAKSIEKQHTMARGDRGENTTLALNLHRARNVATPS